MKKIICLLLSFLLAFGVVACAPAAPAQPEATAAPQVSVAAEAPAATNRNLYTPGTYTATAQGHNGPLTVSMEFAEDRIVSLNVTENTETVGIGDKIIGSLPQKIVETQSLALDALTGATVTHHAILAGAADCAKQAGGDMEALQAPLPTEPVNDETVEADILVIGAGGAGLTAAIEAAQLGAKVVVVEKQGVVGGSTARSGGMIMAAGTKLQQEKGIEDSAESLYEYYVAIANGNANLDKLRILSQWGADNIDFLTELGLVWGGIKALHPTHVERIHYMGAEGRSAGKGGDLVNALEKRAQELGVVFILDCPANSLTTDGDGAVTGAVCTRKNGASVTVASKKTIIASGGFDSSKELKAKYLPGFENVGTSSPVGNVGDGLIMAEAVGADIYSTGAANIAIFNANTNVGLFNENGLIVGQDGKRFTNEYDCSASITADLLATGQKNCYFIVDDKNLLDGIKTAVERGVEKEFASIEDIAAEYGMDAEVLKATVDRYNQMCAAGRDDDFGKAPEMLVSIDSGKYYCIPMIPMAVTGIFTGVVTDVDTHVLNVDGERIPNLYAAGEVMAADMSYKEYAGCGTFVNIAITFGRIAGRTSASEIN